MPRRTKTDIQRFFDLTIPSGTCWLWLGTKKGKYGRFTTCHNSVVANWLAHRWSYEYFRGSIPVGLEIDHVCRAHACVNPWHLEAVTHRVNLQRMQRSKTHCPHGHLYTEANTYRTADGRRSCLACRRERNWNRKLQKSDTGGTN